jgi:hypothetical protein
LDQLGQDRWPGGADPDGFHGGVGFPGDGDAASDDRGERLDGQIDGPVELGKLLAGRDQGDIAGHLERGEAQDSPKETVLASHLTGLANNVIDGGSQLRAAEMLQADQNRRAPDGAG